MTTKMTTNGMRTGSLWLAAALLVGGAAAAAETLQTVGQLADPGVEVRGTARVMGMDAAYVGVAEGADALPWNPAGLGNLKAPEAGWHHLSGLAGAVGESILVGVPAGKLGGLALSADMLDNGRIETRDSVGTLTGQYDAGTVGGSLGWGYALVKDVAIGAAVRGMRQSIGGSRYDSIAVDAGALWNAPVPGLVVGAAVANIGGSGSASDLAMVIRAGASWARELGSSNRLLAAAAVAIEPSGANALDLGAEDTVLSHLGLRVGYRLNFTDQKLTGLSGLTAGVGVSFASMSLDYAYLPFGDLGTLQRVSLTYRKAASTPNEPAQGGTQ